MHKVIVKTITEGVVMGLIEGAVLVVATATIITIANNVKQNKKIS